jgi:hypothetical protein
MSFLATNNFDATKIDPAAGRDPVPAATYKVLIKTAAEKPTQKAGGLGLNVEYKIVDECAVKGRSVFQWINLKNANPTAVEIGQRELSSLCRATNVLRPKSAGEFLNKLVTIKVGVEKDARNPGKLVNVVEEIVIPAGAPAAQVTSPAPVQTQAPTQAQAAPASSAAAPAGAAAAAAPSTTLADESAPWG